VAPSGKLVQDLIRGIGAAAVDRARAILVMKLVSCHHSIGHGALRAGRVHDDAGVRLDHNVALVAIDGTERKVWT